MYIRKLEKGFWLSAGSCPGGCQRKMENKDRRNAVPEGDGPFRRSEKRVGWSQ